MKKLRVAVVIDDFFPASGGIGRSVQTQLEELTAMGHDVTLIAPDVKLEKPRIGHTIETPTYYINGLPAHLSILHHSQRRAKAISKQAQFDEVHTQTERGALVLGAKIARLQNIPHIHTFHANIAGTHQTVREACFGTLLYQVLILPLLRQAAGRPRKKVKLPTMRQETGGFFARVDWMGFAAIADQVDGYTVPAPFMRDMIELCRDHRGQGHVVPTGVNRQIVDVLRDMPRQRSDQRVRFLSMGRLAKEKRLDVMVKAFKRANLADAELVIVGDGDQRFKLRDLARGYPIDFRGHMSGVDALAYELRNADALVLTSYRFDSQALVISEAVAAGLPVLYCDDRLTVATSPKTALLTGPDVKSLAHGFQRLMDAELRADMARATSAKLPELMPDRTAERFVEAYEELIERKARG